ncbi:hypothetical protein K2X05_14310 [bacterium]|nr:hypothetical protein [bacterium]
MSKMLGQISIVSLFLLSLSCQYNPKFLNPTDKMYGDENGAANFYMHNLTGTTPDKYEVYVDKQKVKLEKLDSVGVKLKPGKHSLDIVHKNANDIRDHFEVEVQETPKHIYLCADEKDQRHLNVLEKVSTNCKTPN